jgi:uncharacterized membrane protein
MDVAVAVGVMVGAASVRVGGSVAVDVGLACDVQDASKEINNSTTIFFIQLRFPNVVVDIVLNDMEKIGCRVDVYCEADEIHPIEA